MNSKFEKPYDPSQVEEKIYKKWESSGYFNPENLKSARKGNFVVIMPPVNANGHLHAGHGLFLALQDIIIRYKRMCGFKTLWVPGADHAGFETQVVYEKKLEKEGKSRFKMDPKELFDEIMAFTIENKSHMENEVRRMGASCDWSREKFTLDEDVVKEVRETFKKLYNDGLVYRGMRTVNWCTKHQTSLSDLETNQVEKTDKLYYIKYGPFTVATVRPETIFGDVAVAVNPKDKRYEKYIGKEIEVENPVGKLNLKIIADESVDMEFGTGALKITPAHDNNDFALSQEHNLPAVVVIDQFGKLNDKTGKYSGLKIAQAREKVVEDLKEMGLLEKVEDYIHQVPVCYKCQTTIEPRLLPQWFVKMKPLAEMAIKAAEEKRVKFIPDNYLKIFLYWMNNTIDWNISRQIVWGIPIPAKVCDSCNFGIADLNDEFSKCEECGAALRKDNDTFDTWFSSGQWPLLSLNFPNGKDFENFYPTDFMDTGRDLVFFWVPRMVIFGLYLAKDVPFKDVYFHGMVNDEHGKKMSKSKGNVISPLDLIDKFGTDALRMGLVVGNTPGTDTALAENKIKGYRNFANKIWQASRFVLMNLEGFNLDEKPEINDDDNKNLAEFIGIKKQITKALDNYQFHLAAESIYHYFWHTFADKIIEESKARLKSENNADKLAAQYVLLEILTGSLKLLHPFMPFITEEIWQDIPGKKGKMLMVEEW